MEPHGMMRVPNRGLADPAGREIANITCLTLCPNFRA